LEEAAELGCLPVRFTGGEPLLRNDFEELYLFARKLGLKVLLFTNAALITPRLAKLFVRIPPLEPIEITVYGLKKTAHEAVSRTPGSFEACRRGIRLLIDHKIPIFFKFPILPPNRNELPEFKLWSASIPSFQGPPALIMIYDLRGRRDLEIKNRHIRNLRLSPPDIIHLLDQNRKPYVQEMQTFCSRFIGPPAERLFSCGAGNGRGCVSAAGFFQPCLLLRHPETIYSLENGSLQDALTRIFPEVRRIKAVHPDYLNRCARCFLKGLCEQCPAKSWMEHGTLDTPVNYLCKIAHAQARYLGLLGDNENAWEVSRWESRVKDFSNRKISP